jgi:hypothetical protein
MMLAKVFSIVRLHGVARRLSANVVVVACVLAALPHTAIAEELPGEGALSAQTSPGQTSAGAPAMPLGSTSANIGPASTPLFVRSASPAYAAPAYSSVPGYAPPTYSVLDGGGLSFTATSRGRALDCLTMAIAYEAGREPLAGQQAVAQVILNRTHVRRFPGSVCGVVFDGSQRMTGCQFTFTCDGSIRRRLRETTLESARLAATSVLSGQAPDWVNGATHYHANYVSPYWAGTGTRVTQIGAHIFYRMPGDSGTSATGSLTSNEPSVAALQSFSAQSRPRQQMRIRPSASSPRPMFAPWGVPMAAAGATAGSSTGRN